MAGVANNTLLLQTANILELLLDLQAEDVTRSQNLKQKLLQSVNKFNQDVASAKESARTLPGGELLIKEQDEIIEMLERLKQRKKVILSKFAHEIAQRPLLPDGAGLKVEIDSTASTPAE